MQHFTHYDLLELNEQEAEFKALISNKKKEEMKTPKQTVIDNLLNYSKALSIRKSSSIEFIETILN